MSAQLGPGLRSVPVRSDETVCTACRCNTFCATKTGAPCASEQHIAAFDMIMRAPSRSSNISYFQKNCVRSFVELSHSLQSVRHGLVI